MRWLAMRPAKQDLCVECGAGQGEISAFLAPHFKSVLATDKAPPARAAQHVPVAPHPADSLPVEDQSVDLLVSMQALHHFNVEAHLLEARRVLREGGIFAALSWGRLELPQAVADAYQPVFEAIDPYWEPQREWVVSGYDGLVFPGTEIRLPHAAMEREMTAGDLDAELATWTAVQRALAAGADFPEPEAPEKFEHQAFVAKWPIVGRVFRL